MLVALRLESYSKSTETMKFLFIAVLVLSSYKGNAAPVSGEEVYKARCSGCHDSQNPRIPSREALQKLSRTRILQSLYFGAMSSIARPISIADRASVASHLGSAVVDPGPRKEAFCKSKAVESKLEGNWNGWGPSTGNTRFQTAAAAGLNISQVRGLKLKWAFGFEGDATTIGAPTIVDGRLYVGSVPGTLYALNAESGCIYWTYSAHGPVRSAPLVVRNGANSSLLFGDQNGWFYSVDASSGREQWKRKVDEHEASRLTASPVGKDGIVFVGAASWEEVLASNPKYVCCTFRGSVSALRVKDGSVAWKTFLVPRPTKRGVTETGTDRFGPSGAGVWSAPTIDAKRGRLYVTTGDNYSTPATDTSDSVVALDLKSGQVAWKTQTTANDAFTSACLIQGSNCPSENGPDHDFGSSALLVHLTGGRDVILAGQKSGMVHAFDPDQNGKLLWSVRVGTGGVLGGVQWGMASDGQQVFAAVSDITRRSRKTAGPEDLQSTTLDPATGGGITALRVEDGRKNWFKPGAPCTVDRPGCSPGQSAAVTAISGAVFSGSFDGHLRAFAAEDGAVIWDFDTVQVFKTVNGVAAKGGSMDGAGPVIVGGMLFVNSGYSRFGGLPGNVLLAFSTTP